MFIKWLKKAKFDQQKKFYHMFLWSVKSTEYKAVLLDGYPSP